MDKLLKLISLRKKRLQLAEKALKEVSDVLEHLKESLKAKNVALIAYRQKVKLQVDAIYDNMYEKELTQNELHQRLGAVNTWYAKIKEREVEIIRTEEKIEDTKVLLAKRKEEVKKANISLEKLNLMLEQMKASLHRENERKSEIELEDFKVQKAPSATIENNDESLDAAHDSYFKNDDDDLDTDELNDDALT